MYYEIIVLLIVLTPVLGEVFNVAEEDSELKSVVVLYRHGDRAPTKLYPKDPYNNASLYWPEGLGELTNVGLQHQFKLGKWLRKRYSNFLPETFSPNNIYVQSTDKDRTLMSAAVNLAGLYPPTNTEVWNKNILWRPIPIHTVPEGDDAVLAMKKACPKYDLLYEKLLNSTFFRTVDEKNRQLYEYLSEKTGWNITTIRQIETIYSTLLIEQQYNLTLPPWTIGIFPKKLEYLTALSHATFSFTNQLARLKTGPFFDHLFNHFDSVINTSNPLKMLMLSAHDSTIVNILSAMSLYDYTCPDFTTAIIWELKKSRDRYIINLFYKNSEGTRKLKLPKCTFDCEYSEFKYDLKYFTVNIHNWEIECLT